MVWGDIMTSFWPICVITSAIARFIPIFKLEYFWNAKTYTGEIFIWCHIDGVLSEKPQNTHNLNCLFFNGCLGWKFKNCWNDCLASVNHEASTFFIYKENYFPNRIRTLYEKQHEWIWTYQCPVSNWKRGNFYMFNSMSHDGSLYKHKKID